MRSWRIPATAATATRSSVAPTAVRATACCCGCPSSGTTPPWRPFLCPACQRDYGEPGDRRFHAQTISCPACGPQLHWPGATGNDAITAAAAALRRGAIVALKGIGGFQLLVDPHNAAAVAELRRRKGRPDKPLALLATVDWLERHCRLSAVERRLWWSPAAPILLLRRRPGATGLAEGVAADSPWLG